MVVLGVVVPIAAIAVPNNGIGSIRFGILEVVLGTIQIPLTAC